MRLLQNITTHDLMQLISPWNVTKKTGLDFFGVMMPTRVEHLHMLCTPQPPPTRHFQDPARVLDVVVSTSAGFGTREPIKSSMSSLVTLPQRVSRFCPSRFAPQSRLTYVVWLQVTTSSLMIRTASAYKRTLITQHRILNRSQIKPTTKLNKNKDYFLFLNNQNNQNNHQNARH
jgi:hypothetical protein